MIVQLATSGCMHTAILQLLNMNGKQGMWVHDYSNVYAITMQSFNVQGQNSMFFPY